MAKNQSNPGSSKVPNRSPGMGGGASKPLSNKSSIMHPGKSGGVHVSNKK